MEIIKKNTTFVIGISIPILMILFVAGSIYIPSFFVKPDYDFVYMISDNYDYYNDHKEYSIENGKLFKRELSEAEEIEKKDFNPSRIESKLYLYDIRKNESIEISLEKAQNLNLDSNTRSPDGFEVLGVSQDGGLFSSFWGVGTDYNAKYIKGHGLSKKLNIQTGENIYNSNSRFLGWIKK